MTDSMTPRPAYSMTPLWRVVYRTTKSVVAKYPAVFTELTGMARWIAATPAPYKTQEYYLTQIEGLVRGVYAGNVGGEFSEIMSSLIQGQLGDAYETALKDNELDPEEATSDMRAELEGFIVSEREHVEDFYQAIVDARVDGTPIEPLLTRAELWAGRWQDVYQAAQVTISAEMGDKLIWEYGDTDHCDQCAALDGITAFASEWDELDVRPQNAPNDKLGCGGWRCQCTLTVTDKRRSPGAFTSIMDIVTR